MVMAEAAIFMGNFPIFMARFPMSIGKFAMLMADVPMAMAEIAIFMGKFPIFMAKFPMKIGKFAMVMAKAAMVMAKFAMKMGRMKRQIYFLFNPAYPTISTTVNAPQARNPTLGPQCSVMVPANRLPQGVVPMNTSEYTPMARPLNSLEALS